MIFDKRTHTFKIAENCEINADIYGLPSEKLRPVVIWIHGGALITGHRSGINPYQLEMYLNAGCNVVSIDYRLAPETNIKYIIEDIKDANSWVQEKGVDLLKIDPKRMAVIGHSAGGYLTLMAGFCFNPRPKALVSFYGYGDIIADWYSRPDPFYRQQPLVSEETAWSAVGNTAISEPPEQNNRGAFYLYCRQNGLWPKLVSGYDPDIEPGKFNQFCPIRNISRDYPPTLLLHGDKDTDVPYQQSVAMAQELARFGVEHELITIKDGGHGFDGAGTKDPFVAEAFAKILSFLKRHLA